MRRECPVLGFKATGQQALFDFVMQRHEGICETDRNVKDSCVLKESRLSKLNVSGQRANLPQPFCNAGTSCFIGLPEELQRHVPLFW